MSTPAPDLWVLHKDSVRPEEAASERLSRRASGLARVWTPPFAPWRDASLATLLLIAAIFVGSGGFATIDVALLGYLGATLIAAFGTVWRISAFWRRPASAFYARALVAGLRRPRSLRRTIASAGRDLVAQDFIRRRSLARWAAHMLLSLGVLASFAITVPTIRFPIDGVFAWLLFHGLSIAAVAVVIGAAYFLVARLRLRGSPGAVTHFAIAPLLLLIIVALTGLAMPASRGWPLGFQVAAALHEVSVVVLLVALPFSKLSHVLTRPLQLGARAVRADGVARQYCSDCGLALAPAEDCGRASRARRRAVPAKCLRTPGGAARDGTFESGGRLRWPRFPLRSTN